MWCCCTCRFSRDVVDGSAVWIASIAPRTCCECGVVGLHGFRTHLCTSYIRSDSTTRVVPDVCTMDSRVYGDT